MTETVLCAFAPLRENRFVSDPLSRPLRSRRRDAKDDPPRRRCGLQVVPDSRFSTFTSALAAHRGRFALPHRGPRYAAVRAAPLGLVRSSAPQAPRPTLTTALHWPMRSSFLR